MRDIEALHTAARQFCIGEHLRWTNEYTKLRAGGKAEKHGILSPKWTYTPSAYSLFPRYRLAADTLVRIEAIVPQEYDSLNRIREQLEAAAGGALASLQEEFKGNGEALNALDEQAAAFRKYINTAHDPAEIEPLPHRRTLTSPESKSIWALLNEKWGITGPGFGWYPISDATAPRGGVTVHEELWDKRNGDALFHQFLNDARVERCFVVNEIVMTAPDCEVDPQVTDPRYRGSELFITANGDWVLYSSHESSFTLVGPLADYFRQLWPDCDELGYGGPFHTDDLKGTWTFPS